MKLLLSAVSFLLAFTSLRAAPVPLFDGKTLEGWEGNAKLWRVEEGMIAGGSLTEQVARNEFLATTKPYANFELRVVLKLSGTGFVNSGVQIRSQRVPNSSEMSGYQVDYGAGWYGKLYDESRRNKVVAEPLDPKAVAGAIKEGDWNEYRIRAEGTHIRSWINGVPALDYTEADANIPQDGFLGIQIHGGGKAVVQVKEVTIEELPATPEVMTWEKLRKTTPAKPQATAPIKEGNALNVAARTPQEELELLKVPQGFKVELVASEDVAAGIGKFVPIAFDQQGRLWTTTALEYPVDGNENAAAADALYASKAKDKVLVYDRDPQEPTGYAKKPRVFAEGLAIPLGVLPYKNGCYVQHGHDIVFLEDTDGDGKADKRTVILTGFGVQDSHLFPHQFMRAPGGWIWMAQGAFNYGKVSQPGDEKNAVQFDQTRMAKFRPDGSGFEITSNGPCNIWGLVLNGEGEAFIQEANDFGYPVMPFHEYANYPGCSNRQWKSYAPEFPGTAPDFRMGGTGLSGLALTDAAGIFPSPWADVMLVANPITNRINAIKMHRDGPRWKLEKLPDFLVSEDPWFRPVAISIGPDGCLYIVDWYNKIISHNEVPRNHPDRDKTRGRIWRVSPDREFFQRTAASSVPPPAGYDPLPVPDFTKLSGDELITKLGGASLTQSHLAWQAIADRGMKELAPHLKKVVEDLESTPDRRISALWILRELPVSGGDMQALVEPMYRISTSQHGRTPANSLRNLRREAVAAMGEPPGWSWNLASILGEEDPEVRAQIIRQFAWGLAGSDDDGLNSRWIINFLLRHYVEPPLEEPKAPSTQNGKPIKVGVAYDREFERYLVRMFLERYSEKVASYLKSPDTLQLSDEARLLAALTLDARTSAPIVASLLPKLQRPAGQEELLRLAQSPEELGVGDALKAILSNPTTSASALESLVAVKTRIDAAKLGPLLTEVASGLLASGQEDSLNLGIRLTSAFQLTGAEAALAAAVQAGLREERDTVAGEAVHRIYISLTPAAAQGLKALLDLRADQLDLYDRIARFGTDLAMREEALQALAAARSPKAADYVLKLWPNLDGRQRRAMLELLVATKPGAEATVAAIGAGKITKEDLDGPIIDKLQAVLGADNAALAKLVDSLGLLFRPVLMLDGSEAAWAQTDATLDGPCTIEAWVKLDPQGRKIGNADGLGGAPGQLDFNFYDARPRIYAFPPIADAATAKKPLTPGLWTHLAATRNAAGLWKLYIDGELDSTGTKPAPGRVDVFRLGWTSAPGGTRGAVSDLRLWKVERTADQIRALSDRSLALPSGGAEDAQSPAYGLIFSSAGEVHPAIVGKPNATPFGRLQSGAKIVKTTDFPPILTGDEAAVLDAKYTKYRALANQPGDPARGKQAAAVCQACHLMGPIGGNIGPNLSGVGAMGTEAILRNILQPNAAMENGYRIYRVEMKSGDVIDALFVSEDKDAVVIRQPGAEDRRLPRRDIRDTKYLRRSLMPEGLLDAFTPEQVTDLFAYLKTLR